MRSHLPLVRAMARRYARGREEFDDLVQAGSVGLLKASSRFDPNRGVAFATFVAPAVEGEMRRQLRDRSSGVRLPRAKQRMTSELARIRGELAASLGRAPDARELAAALDADLREVEQLIAADLARHPVALGADDPGVELELEGEPQAESEYRVLLAGGLRTLNARERRIVFLRFHADMTERQIARTLGISQAHVSRLLEGALTKLRRELASSSEAEKASDSAGSAVISPQSGSKIDSVRARGTSMDAKEEREERAANRAEPAAKQTAAPARRPGKAKSANGYSGRILVRMPSELHEQLVQAAERDDVSLNRYVTQALSSSLAPGDESPPGAESASGDAPAPGDEPAPAPRTRGLRVAVATNLAIIVVAGLAAVILLVLALERGL